MALAEPINLNKARKARAKAAAKQAAAENRVKHGRSKTQKQADAAEKARQDSSVVKLNGDRPDQPS